MSDLDHKESTLHSSRSVQAEIARISVSPIQWIFRLSSSDVDHLNLQHLIMSAILLERLLYSRAGIVGPIRTCLPSSSKVSFARYSTDRPDFSDDQPNQLDESPNPDGPSTT
jgi:hypothetical protein